MRGAQFVLALSLFGYMGCATQIHPEEQPNAPSTVGFSRYQNIVVLPISVGRSDNDGGDRRAIADVQRQFSRCIRESLPTSHSETAVMASYPPSTLVVQPQIEDMTKKTVAEKVVFGPFAGSSAILMRVTYTDAGDRTVIAAPSFYVKQGAWSAAWTNGRDDSSLLWDLAKQACDYAFINRFERRGQ